MQAWPTLRKWLTRIFFISTLPILFVYLVSAIFFLFFEEDAKRYFVDRLNDELLTEVKIQDIEFSFLKKFPYASIELKNVSADEVVPTPRKEPLLKAGRIYCLFNWYSLFSGKYHLRRIELENVFLNMKRFKDGKDNFHFWKEQTTTGESSPLAINLSKVYFKNLDFRYNDSWNQTGLKLYVNKANLSGSFADANYTLTAKADLKAENILIGGMGIPPAASAIIDFKAEVDNKNQVYAFDKADLVLGDMHLETSGYIKAGSKPSLDIKFQGKDLSIVSVLSSLPVEYSKFANDYESTGLFYIDGNLKGPLGAPTATATFGISKGQIIHKPTKIALTNVNLDGHFDSGDRPERGSLRLNNITLGIKEGSLSGNFYLKNLINPYITANIKGRADLAHLKHFIPGDHIKHLSGLLTANVSIAGPVGQLQGLATGNNTSTAKGSLQLNKGVIELKSYHRTISNINGTASFDGNTVHLDHLGFNIGRSDFQLNGAVYNFPTCVLSKTAKIQVDAKLNSKYVALDELVIQPIENPIEDTAYVFELSERLDCNLTVNAGRITFRKFSCLNMGCNLKVYNRVIDLSGGTLATAGGSVNLSAHIDANGSSKIYTACEAQFNNIDIHTLFYEFGDFGQTTLQSKHLKGRLTASLAYGSNWSKGLEIDMGSIVAETDVKIENGELIDFEPATAMSKFINIDELKHIYFANLTNHIIISNKLITIPTIEIQSSALNLSASGTHTFDNVIDYHVKVNMRELLSKKFLKNKPQTDANGDNVEDDGRGGMNLFLWVTGTADNPKVKYDTKAVKAKIKENLQKERGSIKGILKNEFKAKEQKVDGAIIVEEDKGPSVKDLFKKKDKKAKTPQKQQQQQTPTIEWEEN